MAKARNKWSLEKIEAWKKMELEKMNMRMDKDGVFMEKRQKVKKRLLVKGQNATTRYVSSSRTKKFRNNGSMVDKSFDLKKRQNKATTTFEQKVQDGSKSTIPKIFHVMKQSVNMDLLMQQRRRMTVTTRSHARLALQQHSKLKPFGSKRS